MNREFVRRALHVTSGVFLMLSPASLGCDAGPGDAGGSLSIRLTDAPFPHDLVQSIHVRVDRVTADHRTLEGGQQDVIVSSSPIEFELLELRNGVSELLGSVDLPRGQVFAVVLTLGKVAVTLVDGRQITFPTDEPIVVTPSPPVALSDDQDRELLLDFDVAMSFRSHPLNPRSVDDIETMVYEPTIRATETGPTTGSIVGTVWTDNGTPNDRRDDSPLEGATVSIAKRGIQHASALTDAAGKFTILHLPQGHYRLETEKPGIEQNVMEVGISANQVLTLPSIRIGDIGPLASREID